MGLFWTGNCCLVPGGCPQSIQYHFKLITRMTMLEVKVEGRSAQYVLFIAAQVFYKYSISILSVFYRYSIASTI